MSTTSAQMRVLGSRDVAGVLDVEDVDALLDQLRPLAARTDPMLVVAPAEVAGRARRTLSMARAGAPGATGVVHATTLPPLARRGLVDIVASLPGALRAGDLLVACEAVESAMVAGAVLGSLAKLASPAPRMAQHVAAWWPSQRFVVLTHPQPQVVRVEQDLSRVPLPAQAGSVHFAATASDVAYHVVVEQLALRLTGHGATIVETPAGSRERWGTARFAEFCAVPQDVGRIVDAALAAADACRSCGAPVVWDSCRFCHARRSPGSPGAPAGRRFAPPAADDTDRGDR